ncbi:MAG: transcriptional regulator, partial [Armatimonadota bacterium]|nr:transcriptional regulator [Armatimonadota bacterium]
MTEVKKERLVKFVESDKERFLFFCGEGFIWESLPVGTRVIYAPPSIEPIANIEDAIENALENPINSDPLSAQFRRGMKVT